MRHTQKKKSGVAVIFLVVISMLFVSSGINAREKLDFEELLKARREAQRYEPETEIEYGLHVNEDGVLIMGDEPYIGHGINYFGLFVDPLRGRDVDYRDALVVLREYNIPFVRFAACGYWPSHFDLYFEDEDEYFSLMDDIVEAAEDIGIGLFPSLFWYNAAVPDLMDEPRNAWGDKNSKTIEFMKEYTTRVVTRYLDSPAVWGWEFGNEFNLEVDLPNPSNYRPVVNISAGTRETRDERDDLTSDMVLVAFEEFAKTVREIDGYRIISNGNANARPSAWNRKYNNSGSRDNEIQHKTMILADNPYPYDVISTHIYHEIMGSPSEPGNPFKVMGREMSVLEYYLWLADYSKEVKMPIYIGEWGASDSTVDKREETKELFYEKLDAMIKAGIPLSALWVYNLSDQEGTWNVTGDNRRVYQLEALRQANLQIMRERGLEDIVNITIRVTENEMSIFNPDSKITYTGNMADGSQVDFEQYEIKYKTDSDVLSVDAFGQISLKDSGPTAEFAKVWIELTTPRGETLESNKEKINIKRMPDPRGSKAKKTQPYELELIVEDDNQIPITSVLSREISFRIRQNLYSSTASLELLIEQGVVERFVNNNDGTYTIKMHDGENIEIQSVYVRDFTIHTDTIIFGDQDTEIYTESEKPKTQTKFLWYYPAAIISVIIICTVIVFVIRKKKR